MSERVQLFQAAVLIIIVLFFDFMERHRPRRIIDRGRNLSLNILALCIVIFAGEAWKTFLKDGLYALALGSNIVVDYLQQFPGSAKIVLGLISADLCLYWIHRAMHRRLLWPTHAFHHSIEELWWLSGSRTSLTHLLLFAIPQVYLSDYIFGLAERETAIAFSLGILVNIWIHTNLFVDLGRLQWLLITPNYHRIHHGARGLSNKNLGFVLTIWDRLFGTYVDPRTVEKDFPLGVISTRKGLLRMIAGL
ncbi:MAG: sterol desaturase family protein [Dissulfurispiraceae bacterium]|jgi:sterol desaturase/sphingolipid hydroxylase (fatty acid hydroxylase superfamily)